MKWAGRYLTRVLGRNLGRSLLGILLATLLFFAFGVLTILRGIYGELYQKVEITPKITGGITYERAAKIANSGYVHDPYYEAVLHGGVAADDLTESAVELVFSNQLNRLVSDPVIWYEGWDERSMESDQAICVLSASIAERCGFRLGDKVLVFERDWYTHLIKTEEDDNRRYELREERRPKAQIIGLIQSDHAVQIIMPAAAWRKFGALFETELILDFAEYTLNDYHEASEFSQYVQDQLSKSVKKLKLNLDTSYADRIYKIHQLIETLYPLTIAAALLLGGTLPGLTVLHASKEISILRALGVKSRKCVSLYALAQVLCALTGLVVGMALVLLIQRPELEVIIKPFSIYLIAHIAVCAIGSGVFAWLCARKHVLAQLQAKE